MLKEMDACGFGNCTNHRVCENACPKEVSITHIARFNREFLKAGLFGRLTVGEKKRKDFLVEQLEIDSALVFGFSFRMLVLKCNWQIPKFVYKT